MKYRITRALLLSVLLVSMYSCNSVSTENNSIIEQNSTENTVAGSKDTVSEYKIGETWTVDGQWSLVINSVTETDYRNEFDETNPAAVYIIDYSYTNIGYKDSWGIMNGLYFVLDEMIVDSNNVMGSNYPGDTTKYAQETPIGASCNAQTCVGVMNAGTFKITVSLYDGNDEKQTATFLLEVE